MTNSEIVLLALGSNLGNAKQNIFKAVSAISLTIGPVSGTSSIYQTIPLNHDSNPNLKQDDFFNAVVQCSTKLSPRELFIATKKIESSLGRDKKSEVMWGPRVIDIDIISYGNLIWEEEDLKLPHPRFCERDFVLVPLAEVAPNFVHPISKKPISEILSEYKRLAYTSYIKNIV